MKLVNPICKQDEDCYEGEIIDYYDAGSIIRLTVDAGEQGIRHVNFARRYWGDLLESLAAEQGIERGGTVQIPKRIRVCGPEFQETVEFIE